MISIVALVIRCLDPSSYASSIFLPPMPTARADACRDVFQCGHFETAYCSYTLLDCALNPSLSIWKISSVLRSYKGGPLTNACQVFLRARRIGWVNYPADGLEGHIEELTDAVAPPPETSEPPPATASRHCLTRRTA
jgi:hypothetical protein